MTLSSYERESFISNCLTDINIDMRGQLPDSLTRFFKTKRSLDSWKTFSCRLLIAKIDGKDT